MSIFSELGRRNVFKVGAAYAIVAWLLIQIADVLLDAFAAPDWVMPVFSSLIILGFPITLVMAWAYEITPEGLKTTSSVEREQSITPATGQRLNYVILGLVVLVVGFLVTDQYVLDQGVQANIIGTSESVLPSPAVTPVPSASASVAIRRFTIDLGETWPLGGGGLSAEVAVSPDGSRIAYSTQENPGEERLYSRDLARLDSQLLPGTERARRPFFSPDSEWVGFSAMGGSSKVSIRGGSPQRLADGLGISLGQSWGLDDSIVASANPTATGMGMGYGDDLVRIPAAGGIHEEILSSDEDGQYIWPQVLPGGSGVLFTVRAENGLAADGSVAVLDLETGEYQTLIAGGYNARYAPTGHIVFVRGETLWAAPFDLQNLKIAGTQAPVVEGVQTNSIQGDTAYAFSDNGLLAYVQGGDISQSIEAFLSELVWVDRDGRVELIAPEQRMYRFPRLSPDGQSLALSVVDGSAVGYISDLFVRDLIRGTLSRLTFDPASDERPLWTPDGQQIAFWSDRDGGGLFLRQANGTGQAERLTKHDLDQAPQFFTSDGAQLVVRDRFGGTNWDLRTLSLDDLSLEPLLATEFFEGDSAISPNQRWIAYVSDETGEDQVYVRPFPDVNGGKWQISTNGGQDPLWSPDGEELFFLNDVDNGMEVFSVDVTTEGVFTQAEPEVMFTGEFADRGAPAWDISPDGERFMMLKDASETGTRSRQATLVIVDNWFEELRRLTPATE